VARRARIREVVEGLWKADWRREGVGKGEGEWKKEERGAEWEMRRRRGWIENAFLPAWLKFEAA